jgi:hypothetical protein
MTGMPFKERSPNALLQMMKEGILRRLASVQMTWS